MRATYLFLAGLLAAGAVGCGGDPFATAPVNGKVTLNGQPLADARITFQPTGSEKDVGPGSAAMTDAEGKYNLKTVDGRRGATVGPHLVRISTLKFAENKSLEDANHLIRLSHPESVAVPEKVPLKYSKDTPLTFTVPEEGTNAANFDLTGEPPPIPNEGQPPKGYTTPWRDAQRPN